MRCSDGHNLMDGDVIYSSYGIPPKIIRGRLYKVKKRWRVSILSGDEPCDSSLSNFRKALFVFYKEKTK